MAIVFFGISGAAYWQNWNAWIFGGALGAGLFALGFGVTAWGKYLMPQGPFVKERHSVLDSRRARAMSAALVERTAGGSQAAQVPEGLFAAARAWDLRDLVAAFPLLRSLGPAAGK